jgi:broad specificity phosphatase PhoE
VGPIEPTLSSIDLGSWVGRAPEQVDPALLGRWLTDPDFASHGGESVTAFVGRLRDWLGACAEADSVAVVTSGTAQGLVAAALGCDFWSIEVAPAYVVNLSRRGARWRVRFG